MDRRVRVGPFFNHHHVAFSLQVSDVSGTSRKGQAPTPIAIDTAR
jgi:hypothetical protein